MDDFTFNIGSSYVASALGSSALGSFRKRKRTAGAAFDEFFVREPSKIEDRRVVATQTLRLDCDFISINVGKDEFSRTFQVHEYVICDASEFFRNSMKDEWSSMRDDPRVISLPEDDPDAFALYRTWAYTGKLAIRPELPFSPETSQERDAHYSTLAYAYVLGERLLDIAFKNAIADVYVMNARGIDGARSHYPTNDDVRTLYEGTGPESPIRKFLVDVWVCRGRHDWLEGDDDVLPREFLVAVMRELLRLKRGDGRSDSMSRPWKSTHEQYHDQGSQMEVIEL
ncbi:hypothetical protein N0V90_010325 [Kalmusia sp. IMI 367209]|nr:hypothetical protein N0V90_010325 [Kalmusia sp. IMI 367209]